MTKADGHGVGFFQLGERSIDRLGYGAMRLTGQPGNFGAYPDWEGGQRLLQRALELGINFIDTAEAYGPGSNEELIASALHPYPPHLTIATKGGIVKNSPQDIRPDGSPKNLRRGCEASLRRLKLDCIELYQLHRPDPAVPFTDSIGTLAELQREGKIRHVGLSNVTIAQIQAAQQIVSIASIQNRLNLMERSQEAILNYCTDQGIMFIPYSPLGAHPLRQGTPLATDEGVLADLANQRGVKPTQIALAWMLHRSPNIVLIPGTTTIAHLEENATAATIDLTSNELRLLNDMQAA